MDKDRRKKIPIGIEFFTEIRTGDYYYVDKTGFIRDLLQYGAEVSLFTRPRCFAKTLNLSMLKAFFEIGCDPQIFEGLEIAKETELCEKYMGKFPVVFITLRGIETDSYETAREILIYAINEEICRQESLLDSSMLTQEYQQLLMSLQARDMDDAALCSSLCDLTELLHEYYGQKAIILIEGYDALLMKAYEGGYYERMAHLVWNMLGQALKTNGSLEFGVMTGSLRMVEDGIFNSLNNIVAFTITDRRFSQYFGFTDQEVREILEYYGCAHCYETVREWYYGYQFGSTGVYCPMDILFYCDEFYGEGRERPQNYWIDASRNNIARRFLEKSTVGTAKRELERLIDGEALKKEIRPVLTYRNLHDSMENIWDILFAKGYLTQQEDTKSDFLPLKIPNMEICDFLVSRVMRVFQENARKDGTALEAFCKAFQEGDVEKVEQRLCQYLQKTIGFRGSAQRESLWESFYHDVLLGLLSFGKDWIVLSNWEFGGGCSGILMELEKEKIGIVIEVKYAGTGEPEAKCQEALEQIKAQKYSQKLREEGMQTILNYGIACRRIDSKVMLVKEE